jgi:hypothetical protein
LSLEVLLARLTTFFYNFNRKKLGNAEEPWKIHIHLAHNAPFMDYGQLDGVCRDERMSSVMLPAVQSTPALEHVQSYQEVLGSVMKNIESKSILYDPLEILLHCQFKGFSFPPPPELGPIQTG